MEVRVIIIWQTIYLCIIHLSAYMLYIPIFKHFRKHALIFFDSLVDAWFIDTQKLSLTMIQLNASQTF